MLEKCFFNRCTDTNCVSGRQFNVVALRLVRVSEFYVRHFVLYGQGHQTTPTVSLINVPHGELVSLSKAVFAQVYFDISSRVSSQSCEAVFYELENKHSGPFKSAQNLYFSALELWHTNCTPRPKSVPFQPYAV